MAPRPRFHRECFLHTVTFWRIFLEHLHNHLSRIHAVTLSRASSEVKLIPGAPRRGPPSTRLPRDARSVHGDRSFDSKEVDFLLFGVTTEEIR